MSQWNAGYVTEIDYTHGYYPELNPLRVKLAFLQARLAPPTVGTACELGFGQGMSINMHAAASVVSWSGNDFNPAQAALAQELNKVSGANSRLYDESFEQFCARPDLPEFDYIGLHGIWTWVSDENRKHITNFIQRKLKVGGVVYISYNTMPGWAAMAPMRNLMTEHATVMGAPGTGVVQRITESLAFVEKLMTTKPAYARANTSINDRLDKIKTQNKHYLAHEYFNRDWKPMGFADLAEWLGDTKLQWACSAHHLDSLDGINLSADQQKLLSEIPDPMFRQTVRDFCVNQQFRKDYWVKGARTLTIAEQRDHFRALRVVLTQPRNTVKLKIRGGLGELTLQEAIYQPVLDALSNHKPQTLDDLEKKIGSAKLNLRQMIEAIVVLAGIGALCIAQTDEEIGLARARTAKLNTLLMNKSRYRQEFSYLASPVIGGGIGVGRFAQLFMLARQNGLNEPTQWASFVWECLAQQGERLIKDGKPLETSKQNLEELTLQANSFAKELLPCLEALGI